MGADAQEGTCNTVPTESLRSAESGPAAAPAELRLFLAGFSSPPCQLTSSRCGRFERNAAAGPRQPFDAANFAFLDTMQGGRTVDNNNLHSHRQPRGASSLAEAANKLAPAHARVHM